MLAMDVLELNSTGANFMRDGTYKRLDFKIGMIEDLNDLVPRNFPIDHPFRDSSFYDFARNDWVVASVNINVLELGTISLDVFDKDLSIPITLDGSWSKASGQDLIVNFSVNVEHLFHKMDFSSPHQELLKVFKEKLSNSFEP